MTPVDVATNYLGAFSGNDPDAIAAFVSDGFRNEHRSALGASCTGRAEYRRRIPHFLDTFTDREYSIEDLVTQPRESVTDVVVSYRFRGTFTETDTRVDIPGVMWFSISEGEIVRRSDTWDSLTFLRQTGLEA